jgi:hypothetical protein
LNRDLSQGVAGDDVAGLQEFLRDEKFFTVEPTGFFGTVTYEALRRWQVAQGIDPVGRVGPVTRERIRQWCGGQQSRFSVSPTIGPAPFTVTFKALAGGFTPYRYAIDFGDGTAPQEIRCPENPNIPLGREVIRVGDVACTKEYRPVCGSKPIVCITTPCEPLQETYSNRCMMQADGAAFLYEGQCRADVNPSADRRCKSWFDGCNTCSRQTPDSPAACTLRYCEMPGPKYCTTYFDADTGNKSPSISSFSGPTTLSVGQAGT